MAYNLMGLAEVAGFLGVSRARADQLARQVGFPSPVATLQAGRIWKSEDVERWARKAGRPRAAPASPVMSQLPREVRVHPNDRRPRTQP